MPETTPVSSPPSYRPGAEQGGPSSQAGEPDRVPSAKAQMSPSAAAEPLRICGNELEEHAMSAPPHDDPVRDALREAVLALGAMVAPHMPGEALGDAVARAISGVVRRHLRVGAGMSTSMNAPMQLQPHPAIKQLLGLVSTQPAADETPAAAAAPCAPFVDDEEEWLRVPGLMRSWELGQVVDGEHDFRIEPAGHYIDGTELYAIYAQAHEWRKDR